MYNNLQPTDAIIIRETAASSVSSNVVFVGGAFTVQFPDGQFECSTTSDPSAISAYVTNGNPLKGTPPVGGHHGDYEDNPGFETAWSFAGLIGSSTGVAKGAIFNYTKPVRYLYLKAPISGHVGSPLVGLRGFTNGIGTTGSNVVGASLTGYVYNGSNL